MTDKPTIAIVGGGFSGAAVAFHLARAHARARVLVFEPRLRLGGGLAYGGDDPVHRVNVPAARMSLLPEDPDHFARWLDASGVLAADTHALAGGEAYPRRREFGRYVAQALAPHVASGAIRHIRARVVSLKKREPGWLLTDEAGGVLRADLAVIATTHCPSTLPAPLRDLAADPRVIADPLIDNVVAGIGADERVMILGAGLTAADLVAALDSQGHRGPIMLVSRRGLRARGRSVDACPPEGDFLNPPLRSATALLRRVRAAIRACESLGGNWQSAIEAVRNQGQDIWRALDPQARRRVVRHLRPFWDVHRFRAAPQIEAVLDARLKAGALALKRARIGTVSADPEGLSVELRSLRAGTAETHHFERLIVAIGPTHRDILAHQPFLAELAAAGEIALDPTELGLRTSRDGHAIGIEESTDPTLFIAGPLARGTFGEMMGLPQVSVYAQFIAGQLAAALTHLGAQEDAQA